MFAKARLDTLSDGIFAVAVVGLRQVAITPASGAGRQSATPADIGLASDRLLAAGDRVSFVDPWVALWALALNFAAPVIRVWSKWSRALD